MVKYFIFIIQFIVISNTYAENQCELHFVHKQTGEPLEGLESKEIFQDQIPEEYRNIELVDLTKEHRGETTYPCKDSWRLAFTDSKGKAGSITKPIFANTPSPEDLQAVKTEILERASKLPEYKITGYQSMLTDADDNAKNYLECVYIQRENAKAHLSQLRGCLSGKASEHCSDLKNEGITKDILEKLEASSVKGLSNVDEHYNYAMIAAGIDPTQYSSRYQCGDEDDGPNSEYTNTCSMIDREFKMSRGEGQDMDAFCTSIDLIENAGLKYFVSDVNKIIDQDAEKFRSSYSYLLRAEAIGQTLENFNKHIGGSLDDPKYGQVGFLSKMSAGKCGKKYPGTKRNFTDGLSQYESKHKDSKGFVASDKKNQDRMYEAAMEIKSLLNGTPDVNSFVCLGKTPETIQRCCKTKELKSSYEDSRCSSINYERKQKINKILQDNPLLTTGFKNVEGEGSFSDVEKGLYDIKSWDTLDKIINSKGDPEKLQDIILDSKKKLAKQYMDYIEKICDTEAIPNKNLFLNPQLTQNVTSVLGFKETQKCLEEHFMSIEKTIDSLRKTADAVCIPASFTGIGTIVCGAYAIGGATYDNSAQQSKSRETAQLMSGQGGAKGFIGAAEEAQAADDGLGNIALNTVLAVPGVGMAKGLGASKAIKTAEGLKFADNAWTAIVTGRNSVVSYTAFSDSGVDYSDKVLEYKHMTEGGLRAHLAGSLIRYDEEERERIIEAAVAKHKKLFPFSSQDKFWRTRQMRELTQYYGSIPVAEKLLDEDILKLRQIEEKMDAKGLSDEERKLYRKMIAQNINKVDNPNGFLNLVDYQIDKHRP